jgi:organic radical activating enzyme
MELIKVESNLDKDLLRIELFLSNVCNYKCWYCYPGSHEGTHGWPEFSNIKENLSYLLDYYKTHQGKKKFLLHIIGGEPTIWKELGEFAKYFKNEYNCLISISSNGSRNIKWWNEYGHYFDHVMLSCHYERIDTDHIKEVGDLLYNKNVMVNAMVLMDPANWYTCKDIIAKLKTSKRRWFISAVEIQHTTIKYTKEQQSYISSPIKRFANIWYFLRYKKTPKTMPTIFYGNTKKKVKTNYISLFGLNKFFGWSCDLGIDTFFIDKTGDLQGACGERLFDLDFKYNIFDLDFKDKFTPTIVPTTCSQHTCNCQPEINCNKRKIIPLVPV